MKLSGLATIESTGEPVEQAVGFVELGTLVGTDKPEAFRNLMHHTHVVGRHTTVVDDTQRVDRLTSQIAQPGPSISAIRLGAITLNWLAAVSTSEASARAER